MKKFLISLILFIFCSSLYAGTIKDIVIFGDSLSDDGNLYQVLRILPKSPPYYQGRFSNGPTWAEYVGQYFYRKSFVGYANYAYGGATAIWHSPVNDSFISPMLLEEEIDGYLARNLLKDKSKTLFAIWIGANDYLYDRSDNIEKLTDDVVKKIANSIQTLIKKGGKHFIVFNLPSLAGAPYARNHNLTERFVIISEMHRQKLTAAIQYIKTKEPSAEIVYMDVHSIFNDLLTNIDKYNRKYNKHVTELFNACYNGSMVGYHQLETARYELLGKTIDSQTMQQIITQSPSLHVAFQNRSAPPCENVDSYLFWDELHPTAVVHDVFGQIVSEVIEEHFSV